MLKATYAGVRWLFLSLPLSELECSACGVDFGSYIPTTVQASKFHRRGSLAKLIIVQHRMHTRHLARCHFAAFRRQALMVTTKVPQIQAQTGQLVEEWALGARLGRTLRARELTTFLPFAFPLASFSFNPRHTFRRLSRQRHGSCSDGVQIRSCAEQRFSAMLCEALGLGRLASAGQSLGCQSLTSWLT